MFRASPPSPGKDLCLFNYPLHPPRAYPVNILISFFISLTYFLMLERTERDNSQYRELFTVIHSSVLILLRKSKNDGAIWRNMLFMDLFPFPSPFPFYMRTVQSQTGTKVTRVGSVTETKLDWSEFIFRLTPCKCVNRSVWRSIWTHTGLSLSWSHVITPLVPWCMYGWVGVLDCFFRHFFLFPEIVGSDGTPYAGGSFRLEIHLPERWV